jgi:phenylalanyl-tRNA synthetase alpha chain
MNASQVLEGLSYQEKKVLLALRKTGDGASPEKVLEAGGFSQLVEVMSGANWLQSKGLIEMKEATQKVYSLRSKEVAERPLPERRALEAAMRAGGALRMADLEPLLAKGEVPIAVGWLRRKNLATMQRSDSDTIITLTEEGMRTASTEMEDERALRALAQGDVAEGQLPAPVIAQLKGRQDMIVERAVVSRAIHLTPLGQEVLALGIELKEEVAQLTPELIQSGKWREVSFRRYDISTFAPTSFPAKKHPLTRIADEVRRIFLRMGFQEIDDEYVQPAFWNMDTLFTPQDHPAREMQDTFYLRSPSRICLDQEKELMEKVRSVHENGGDSGSLGWRYKWSREEAERALLRTHTTVNTIRYLSQHPDPPVKVFSLSRVFRKEAIDSTHLPEFVQIEGIVMEEHASFDMLVGILREFYRRMGFEQIRVRPGYFPYTEPSLEVEVMWNGKWMELGGAGIFRPEVTAPFGIKYPVLAWGQGFERLAMLRWGLKDIRDLYVTDVEMLRQSPIL